MWQPNGVFVSHQNWEPGMISRFTIFSRFLHNFDCFCTLSLNLRPASSQWSILHANQHSKCTRRRMRKFFFVSSTFKCTNERSVGIEQRVRESGDSPVIMWDALLSRWNWLAFILCIQAKKQNPAEVSSYKTNDSSQQREDEKCIESQYFGIFWMFLFLFLVHFLDKTATHRVHPFGIAGNALYLDSFLRFVFYVILRTDCGFSNFQSNLHHWRIHSSFRSLSSACSLEHSVFFIGFNFWIKWNEFNYISHSRSTKARIIFSLSCLLSSLSVCFHEEGIFLAFNYRFRYG